MQRIFSLFLCCFFLAGLAHAQSTNRMTPELLWKLGRFSGASLNGAGTHVAYIVRNFELSENSGTSDLHLIDLTMGTDQLICEKWAGIDSVQWAGQTSNEKLFIAGKKTKEPEESTQVWTLTVANPQPEVLTNVEGGVANLKVAPDGRQLAFTVDVKMDPTANELHADLPLADARIIDGLMYRHWNAWHDFAYSHLHVMPLDSEGQPGIAIDLMPDLKADCPVAPFGGSEQFNWAPDGSAIAFTTKISADPAQSTDSAVYLKALGSETSPELITPDMPGYDNNPVFSSDGNLILFHSMERPGFEADRNRIMVYDRSQKTRVDVTLGLDQTAHNAQWSPTSNKIYFTSETRGTTQLFEIDLSERADVTQPQVRQVTAGRYSWDLVQIFPDGKSALVTQQSMLRPAELLQLSLLDGSTIPLTHINDAILNELEMPIVEERLVEASDGKQIHCWVIHPPEFDPKSNVKWPMLTYCQGGPQSQVGQSFSYRWNFHLMAARGYVILAPNRRGLPGFGQDWNDQISGDWGGQAMRDILAATDDVANETYIDRNRMGAVGASFGGYTVYWLMGNHADRFKTMISHCGVFNLESMYGSTEELFFVNWDLGGPYWKNADVAKLYQRFSPNRFVANWKTPLLVIHGEKDFRVPVTQGMEAFTAAQLQGVPARFLYFPEEGHWVMKPQNGVLWHRVFFDWLDRYLMNQDSESGAGEKK